jgi:SAM-dependent methyltransferase
MDVFGKVLKDFYHTGENEKLWLHNNYGKPEDMPVDVFFRPGEDMPELEHHALSFCSGKILDIGAGAGSHALLLQSAGHDVTALEICESACEIMLDRGVKKIINRDLFDFEKEQFDTLLLLMNGIGLCGDINGLRKFLSHSKKLLKPGGQLIFDSSDISYLYTEHNMPPENYYGEISYQYEYQSVKGDLFKWLYVDYNTLSAMAENMGWNSELLYDDDMDQYLARLTIVRPA